MTKFKYYFESIFKLNEKSHVFAFQSNTQNTQNTMDLKKEHATMVMNYFFISIFKDTKYATIIIDMFFTT